MNQQEFLDEIEREMHHIVDGYYASVVPEIIEKIKDYLNNEQHWNPAAHLPTPNIPLIVKLSNGEQVDAVRPKYVTSRVAGDLGYRDTNGNVLMNVKEWAII
ncbi:hypothetical protein OAO65_02155 [Flavobacteriales bacterium]|nr:hypothetical protein [Flavobacteriales bacterium]